MKKDDNGLSYEELFAQHAHLQETLGLPPNFKQEQLRERLEQQQEQLEEQEEVIEKVGQKLKEICKLYGVDPLTCPDITDVVQQQQNELYHLRKMMKDGLP